MLPAAHALLIEIAAYPTMPLPPVHDADDLAGVLRDPALCGYPPDQVRVLRDAEATREVMVAAIRALVAAAVADSTVLLYFSGHGGRAGASYLLPIDVDLGDLERTAISAGELGELLAPLRERRVRRVLLIFDMCHAGGLDHAKDLGSAQPGLSAEAQDALVAGSGWALFASSDEDERSYVLRDERNGLFTKHLLSGLRGELASDDGYVRVFDLFEHLQPRVVLEAPQQHPVFKCALRENFAVARCRGGQPGLVRALPDGRRYDAVLSYAQADARFVRETLLPAMREAGLRVATAGTVVELGMDRVLGLERGLELARRTVVVVSRAYLRSDQEDDQYADHLVLQGKHQDIRLGRFSVVPVYLDDPEQLTDLPLWLSSLVGVCLGDAVGGDRTEDEELERLLRALKSPVPRRR